ncbi:MAG: hypothetical protein L6Q66_02865 [Bacteroidia bacterium]|nr:hypothetical protein [Bacteroidia bacterium]
MMQKKLLSIFLLLQLSMSVYAQKDSVVYHQQYESLFSNVYVFYSDHTFYHEFSDDSFGHTIGKGTYKDKGKTRYLYFTNIDTSAYKKNKHERFKFEQNEVRKLKWSKDSFTCKDYHGTVKSKVVVFIREKTQ